VVARSWALMRQGRALRSLAEDQPARWCRLWRSNTTIWLRLIATMSLATSRRRTWFAVGRVVPARLASISWVTGITMPWSSPGYSSHKCSSRR